MKRTLLSTLLITFLMPICAYADVQKDFTDIAVKYKNEMVSPKNDIQMRLLLKKRTKDFNALNFDGNIQNWKGTISRISTFGDDIYFRIELAPKVELVFHTDMDDPIVEKIVEMKQGQQVVFSGQLEPEPDDKGFHEMSLTTKGGLEKPEFKLILTDIKINE